MKFTARSQSEAFRVIVAIVAVLVVPASIALRTIAKPGLLHIESKNPTPLGYTWSLLLFVIPTLALVWWFMRRPDLQFPRKAFLKTMVVLVPTGFGLDILFGNAFFIFPNRAATLGLSVPAIGGTIPIEEFVFYAFGFVLVLLSYLWADEYWLSAYNIPDYQAEVKGMPRIVRFHAPSVVIGIALIAAAFVFKRFFSHVPEGFPSYFTYVVLVALIPAAGFFHNAQHFINWRAFGFTCFLMVLISLLWEVTLAVPYGWWGFQRKAIIGLTIRAWSDLPIEEICVWFAVSFTTIIIYEVVKIWLALGTRALEAFFGCNRGK